MRARPSSGRAAARRTGGTRRVVALAWLCAAGSVPVAGQTLHVDAVAWTRGVAVDARPSFLRGDFGRFGEGPSGLPDMALAGRAEAQLGLDWTLLAALRLHVHGLARLEPTGSEGSRAGLVSAYLQYRIEPSPSLVLRARAGLMFPGLSRENTGELWASPYTMTFSALNSWVGEEVRPAGLEASVRFRRETGTSFELAGMAFGGADTAGALLAWRGFAFHDRLSVVAETLPLPPLPSLGPDGGFRSQRDDGTRGIDELDDRVGFLGRARWDVPGRVTVQAGYFDNRGDRGLHRGQYSWDTRLFTAGGDLHLGERVVVVGEVAIGDTGMGPRQAGHVDVRFRTGYLLASYAPEGERVRVTLRWDRFENTDRDDYAENSDEDGDALTLAAFWSPRPRLRVGVELMDVRSKRPAAALVPGGEESGGRRAAVEVRFGY